MPRDVQNTFERVVDCAEKAVGQEGLVLHEASGEDVFLDGIVVDEPLERFAHLRLRQDRVALVEADVEDRSLVALIDREILVARERVELVLGQAARVVDVAFLEEEPLGGGFDHVARDEPLDLRRAPVPLGVGVERVALVRAPACARSESPARRKYIGTRRRCLLSYHPAPGRRCGSP